MAVVPLNYSPFNSPPCFPWLDARYFLCTFTSGFSLPQTWAITWFLHQNWHFSPECQSIKPKTETLFVQQILAWPLRTVKPGSGDIKLRDPIEMTRSLGRLAKILAKHHSEIWVYDLSGNWRRRRMIYVFMPLKENNPFSHPRYGQDFIVWRCKTYF